MKKRTIGMAAAALCLLANTATADGATPSASTPRGFRELLTKDNKSQGLFAGPHASQEVMQFLKQKGIKTIISLQTISENLAWNREFDPRAWLQGESPEHRWAQAAKMNFIRKSWNAAVTVPATYTNDVAKTIAALLKDPSKSPVYVHCQYGMDRTGVAVAAHRVMNEKWTPKEAFYEWRNTTGRCALSNGQFDKSFNNMVTGMKATAKPGDTQYDFQIAPVKADCMKQ